MDQQIFCSEGRELCTKRGDVSRLLLLLVLILILGIHVSMDLRRAMDRRRLDVTPHRVRWGIDTTAIQWRGEHLPSPDLGPGHAIEWRARTGGGVLRGVRR